MLLGGKIQSDKHNTRSMIINLYCHSGPCKMISPFYAQLSTKYPQVVFAKIDVDQVKEVAAACKVTSM